MAKKQEELKQKIALFESIAMEKLGDGYYKVLNCIHFNDGTYEVKDESIPKNVNACEDTARRAILAISMELQSK